MHAIDLASVETEDPRNGPENAPCRESILINFLKRLCGDPRDSRNSNPSSDPLSFFVHRGSQSGNIYTALRSESRSPHNHSKSLKQPPNHITTIGIRYVVSALNSDIFGLLSSPLFTEMVWLLLVPALLVPVPLCGSMSTRGGVSTSWTTGAEGCFGGSGSDSVCGPS